MPARAMPARAMTERAMTERVIPERAMIASPIRRDIVTGRGRRDRPFDPEPQ